MLDQDEGTRRFTTITIKRPVDFDKDDYETLDVIVAKVLEEEVDETGLAYRVRFGDTHVETVSILSLSLAQI
jgi:hypothetical protein